ISVQRPRVAALQVHVVVAAKRDGPEPIPFRLVQIVADGELLGELGKHRFDRWLQRHSPSECLSVIHYPMTAFVLMGVSGSGKSTVGRRVAAELALTFIEGDEFHPQSNVQKMAGGTPLANE